MLRFTTNELIPCVADYQSYNSKSANCFCGQLSAPLCGSVIKYFEYLCGDCNDVLARQAFGSPR